ncbi:MAG: response regulator [Candidatus Pelagadaptatus aseana]|uniref:response regulator n=1 Tax=Candidatus Pelagadaptatus aseana TaxID=3120508 RepID=UPI0039B31FE2
MNNLKILVVDDEFASRVKMATVLKQLGTCEMRDDGWQAVIEFTNALKSGAPYNLILLDIEMPGMSGSTALSKIREREKEHGIDDSSRTRIVMVTSHNDRDNVVNAMRQGCDSYIVKPFTKEAIYEKLKTIGLINNP